MDEVPPEGERAVAYGPNTDFRVPDVGRYCREANDATMIVLKIESRKGVESAEAMFSTGLVDALVFGPVDLSVDWGVPGQTDHPEIVGALDRVSKLALSHRIAVIGHAVDRESYQRERERGAQIFAVAGEIDLLREGAERFMEMVG